MTEHHAVITEARIPASRGPDVSDTSHAYDSVPEASDVVHVWLIPTDQPPAVLGELAALLDDEEHRRAATHRSALQRARYVVAHGATRRIVAAYLDLDPGEFSWRRGEHGKPEPDVAERTARISISASSQVALVAVAQPGTPAPGSTSTPREVGIDIERLVSDEDATRLSARFFPAEQAKYVAAAREHGSPAGRFATLWCRKEACVKALGGRLVQGLPLAVQGEAPLIVRFADSTQNYEYCVSDVPAPRLFRAAVALKGAAAYRLRCHVWSAGTGVPPLYRSHD